MTALELIRKLADYDHDYLGAAKCVSDNFESIPEPDRSYIYALAMTRFAQMPKEAQDIAAMLAYNCEAGRRLAVPYLEKGAWRSGDLRRILAEANLEKNPMARALATYINAIPREKVESFQLAFGERQLLRIIERERSLGKSPGDPSEANRAAGLDPLATLLSFKPRLRMGCLQGCLKACLGAVALVIVFYAVQVFQGPWVLHLGGSFTPFTGWSGYGRIVSTTGARNGLYLTVDPVLRDSEDSETINRLTGVAWLCTPQGRQYEFRLSGRIQEVWLDADGKRLFLEISDATSKDTFSLFGAWHGRRLMLEDQGTLNDGSLTPFLSRKERSANSQAPGGSHASVTLSRGTLADFRRMCQSEIQTKP